LPLLEKEVVPTGWISKENFLAGYGAAQAVSGPLFTFAAYCGALINGIRGAALALFSIFLPGFLLVIGVLPFWNTLRVNSRIKGAFNGVNAAVVGILLAALYNPIGTSALLSPSDFGLAALLFGMLIFWKFPPWLIVLAGAVGSAILGALGI
jgi:chromate transporter